MKSKAVPRYGTSLRHRTVRDNISLLRKRGLKMTRIDHPESPYKDVEFLDSLEGRTLRILSEYLGPMARLNKAKVNSTVLFLGSARTNPSRCDSDFSKYYWEAEELAHLLTRWAIPLKPKGKNFVICTGGGPGIMEAANRGSERAGGKNPSG